MAEIKAFGALRFTDTSKLDELVCPPYDIISAEQRAAYLARNPHNIIRLELPKADGDEAAGDPYQTAGDTLRAWLDANILACDEQESLYIYEEAFTAHGRRMSVKGLVCRVKLEPFSAGVVLPHEETLSRAKADRFNLMCGTGCNFSSIYSLYFDEKRSVYPAVERLSAGAPLLEFTTGDGIVHRVWRITDAAEIEQLTAAFADKKLYIADGHHRYETALNYREHLRGQRSLGERDGANYIMMTLVNIEHPGLVVFPTHRIVHSLDRFDAAALLRECAAYFDISACALPDVEQALAGHMANGSKAMALYDGKKASVLALRDKSVMAELLPRASGALRELDVSILHTLILERLLGIDRENLADQTNLTYTRDIAEAAAAVDSGKANCAFLLNPTLVSEIADVAGAGEKMPQKSTYFYPKLITGHIMNLI